MSDQFQYVMTLVSIIIGLGITNVLLALGAVVDRLSEGRRPLRLSWASGFWMAFTFLVMIMFWWWEFRLLELLKRWELWNYLLVICYAIVLFLQATLLIPRNWDAVDDLDEYFLAKRRWFYPVLLLSSMVDLLDSYMKGGMVYIVQTGTVSWGSDLAFIPVALIGMRSRNIRVHSAMAITLFLWQVLIGFDLFPLLASRA